MIRRPVAFFAGTRSIALPYVAYVFVLFTLFAACTVTLVNSVLPILLGTEPILSVPAIVQSVANVLSYFAAVAVMIALMLFLFGLWESILATRRFTDFERLIPLSELLLSGVTIAPNLQEKDRILVLRTLQQLAEHGRISSIIAPATAADIENGSVDRLFITTTQNASEFRRMVRGLKCDDISRVPTRSARQIVGNAQFGHGSVWLLTWD